MDYFKVKGVDFTQGDFYVLGRSRTFINLGLGNTSLVKISHLVSN